MNTLLAKMVTEFRNKVLEECAKQCESMAQSLRMESAHAGLQTRSVLHAKALTADSLAATIRNMKEAV